MEFSVMMGILMEGFALTAEIFLITLVGSLPLGVVVALARMSKFKPLAWLAQLYISILRGTPLMLQLMAGRMRLMTWGSTIFMKVWALV